MRHALIRWWRRMLLTAAVVAAPCGVAVACTGATVETPPGTVGAIEPPATLETLLPVVTDSTVEVIDTGSVAVGTMFGGNPCTALTDRELQSAAALVAPSGTDPVGVGSEESVVDVTAADTQVSVLDAGPVSAEVVSADACRFVVREPLRYSVLVRVRSVFDFASPDLEDPAGGTLVADTVSGIGIDAIGIDRGATYEVVVEVDAGYFSLSAPDRDTALRLARAAADDCCG